MKLSVKLLASAASACIAIGATPALAASFLFELTGGKTASFVIDAGEAPDFFSSSSLIGDQIRYDNVAGTFGGTAQTAGSVGFGTNLIAAFQISGSTLDFTQYAGPSLFSGSPSMPTFLTGSFALSSITSGPATLTISQIAGGAIPEPATWAMMMLGFGMLGGAMRYRQARVRFA